MRFSTKMILSLTTAFLCLLIAYQTPFLFLPATCSGKGYGFYSSGKPQLASLRKVNPVYTLKWGEKEMALQWMNGPETPQEIEPPLNWVHPQDFAAFRKMAGEIYSDRNKEEISSTLLVLQLKDKTQSAEAKGGLDLPACQELLAKWEGKGYLVLMFQTISGKTFLCRLGISTAPTDLPAWSLPYVIEDKFAEYSYREITDTRIPMPIFRQWSDGNRPGNTDYAFHRRSREEQVEPGNLLFAGSSYELKTVRAATAEFQLVNRPGKHSLLKMDTANQKYRWMYEKYRDGKQIEIIHIPNFKTIHRVITLQDHPLPPEEIQRVDVLGQRRHNPHHYPEFYDFWDRKIDLTWRGASGILDDHAQPLGQFKKSREERLELLIDGESIPIEQLELVLVPEKGKGLHLITDRMDYPQMKMLVADLQERSSIYIQNILIEKDGKLQRFPLTFLFNFL